MIRSHCRRTCLTFCTALAFTLVSAPSARAQCDPSSILLPGPTYASGANPRQVLPLDLNEDGILDLVALVARTNSGVGLVAVFIGNGVAGVGDGTFTIGPTYTVGDLPFGIVSGDFNSDDIIDVAVTNFREGSYTILLGQGAGGVGDGTFSVASTTPVGANPYGIATADFNGDDIQDLVIAENKTAALYVLLGNGAGGIGDGTFADPDTIGISGRTLSVVTGDFDENGVPDIACTINLNAEVSVLLGTGSGTFMTPVNYFAGDEPFDLRTDDIDEDGITDLVVGNGAVGGVAVLFGDGVGGVGNGAFVDLVISGDGEINVGSVVVADFDADGVRDVLAAASVANTIYLVRGLGSRTFGPPIAVASGFWPIGLNVGDFDEDGTLDVTYGNFMATMTSERIAVEFGQCVAPASPSPILDDVRDTPNDQGGKVFVVWRRSPLDGETATSVNGYRVWRRIPPLPGEALAARDPSRVRVLTSDASGVTYWEAMADLPAQRLAGYGFTSPTTQDSLPESNPFTAFFVTALTADPNVFYDSAIDSGYSVDNLPPPSPAPFVGQTVSGGFALHWGVSDAPDLAGYRLHRGTSADFVPGPGNLLSAQPDTGYFDTGGLGQHFYKLAAIDIHANVGPFAVLAPDGATPALVSLVMAEATPERVTIVWYSDLRGTFRVERAVGTLHWDDMGALQPDGTGRLRFIDDRPTAGESIRYRLIVPTEDGPVAMGETLVHVPAWQFALAVPSPNPNRGDRLAIAFTLAVPGEAELRLIDPSGRVIEARRAALAAGEHRWTLEPAGALAPGMYFLQLKQAGRVAMTKVAIIR